MKKVTLLICAAACTLSVNACTPTSHVRGNLVEDFRLDEVKPGVDTASDVLRKIGSPTTKAPFDDKIWYYIGQETEKRGILDEDVTNERILVLTFNDEGIVQSIKDADSERMPIPYDRQKTPTSGNEMTAMQQFLGNLGRFNGEE